MRKEHKKIKIALTALLLSALMLPTMYFAFGQSDNFFFIDEEEGMRGTTEINAGVGSGSGVWGMGALTSYETGTSGTSSATVQWEGFGEGVVPVGGGLLVLAASGVCYAAFNARRAAKTKENEKQQ